jgi:uncharacterized membrane protein (DUF4010 family)
MILLANLTMLLRLTLMGALVQPALLPGLATTMGAALAAALPFVLWLRPRARLESDLPLPVVRNPTDLRVALGFGFAYGLVSLLAAWGAARLGDGALYAIAAISGLTDVDAITLSSFRLFGEGQVGARAAVATVGIAVVSNLAFKAGLAFVAGNRALGGQCALAFSAMAAAIGIAFLFGP